ncbi:MAG: DUF4392 domain-containing protein [Bacillati bacterium ANGP1]|uniref:DUF4392 domain-containing protein n=1 Tax=Candidatus Segetimicrobium genomatis TaxID=2569760 RepID=A0A537JMH6_9BACT|nr:MAG: DUF4392 domain-containing protein [Terrabacteria group bacterium ANGP1]
MTLTPAQRTIGEGIDRLVSIEITGRGVIGDLYQAARALQDAPLCLTAAARLLEKVHKGQVVILATGLPMYPWFAGEQDGPVGTATLARALLLAVDAGLYVRPLDDALSLPTTAAVLPFPLEWEEAAVRAQALLDTLRPSALVAIERTGANEHRQYHSSSGKRLTDYCGKIDTLFASAGEREILTIGVGDGGNEIGCAAIRDSVLQAVPHAARCACPCGGTTIPEVPTDLLIAAAISNWGAYGVEAGMALLLERPGILHGRDIDARVHDLCAAAGANNDGPGLLDVGADAVAAPLHGHIVDLLGRMVESGIDFGRLYREPRYPWF